MSINKIITHPYTLLMVLSCVLVSGDHWGGVFLFYILLGLPHGSAPSLLLIAGTCILVFSHYHYRRTFNSWAEFILNMVGIFLLGGSLFVFFYQDKGGYNENSFHQTIPLLSVLLFSLLSLYFIGYNVLHFFDKRSTLSVRMK